MHVVITRPCRAGRGGSGGGGSPAVHTAEAPPMKTLSSTRAAVAREPERMDDMVCD
jgi:hypothetical protein